MPTRSTSNVIRPPVVLLAAAEFLVFVASAWLCWSLLANEGVAVHADNAGIIGRACLVGLILVFSFLSMGLYQFHQRIDGLEIVSRVLVGIALGSVAIAVVYFMFPSMSLGFGIWSLSMLVALGPVLLMRYLFLVNVDENIFRRNILILGAGERAAGIAALRRRADRRGFKIVGTIAANGDQVAVDPAMIIQLDKPLLDIARDHKVDDIVIALDEKRGTLPIRDLLICKLHGIDVLDLLEFLERESGKIRADLVSPGWLIFSSGFRVSALRRTLKRTLDIAVSAVALALTWPIFLLIALAIKLEGRGPVLYKQVRVGQNGEPFKLLKFRSMRIDAEADGRAVWARENDDRITGVGRVLRKFRLDELPQLLNVLRGQMSVVGPRPERPEFVRKLGDAVPYYDERHAVKPGITGWAQLKYSYGSSTQDALEKLHYDLYYVKNHGLILDIAIMIQTIEILFWGKGAR